MARRVPRQFDQSRKSARPPPSSEPAPIAALSVRPDASAIVADSLARHGVVPADRAPGAGDRRAAAPIFEAYAEAVERTADPWLGLQLGADRGPSWLGQFGNAVVAMPSLRASIDAAQRLIGMLVDGQRLVLTEDRHRASLTTTLPEGLAPSGAQVVLQSSIVLMANLFDAYVGPGLWPIVLCFACPPPPAGHAGARAVRRPFRRLRFSAPTYGLEFPSAYLDLGPSQPPASAEHRRLVKELEHSLRQLEASRSLLDRLHHSLLSDLPRRPQLAEVARSLRMSARSLQLSLTRQGRTFHAELDRVRLYVARQYLSRTDVPLGAIATRLGFLSAAVFSRFFRRAAGLSPREYREKNRKSRRRHSP